MMPAKPTKAERAVKAARPTTTASSEAGERMRNSSAKYAAMIEAAAKGKLPEPPDFSADTYKSYRKKLEGLVAAAKMGDLDFLRV